MQTLPRSMDRLAVLEGPGDRGDDTGAERHLNPSGERNADSNASSAGEYHADSSSMTIQKLLPFCEYVVWDMQPLGLGLG